MLLEHVKMNQARMKPKCMDLGSPSKTIPYAPKLHLLKTKPNNFPHDATLLLLFFVDLLSYSCNWVDDFMDVLLQEYYGHWNQSSLSYPIVLEVLAFFIWVMRWVLGVHSKLLTKTWILDNYSPSITISVDYVEIYNSYSITISFYFYFFDFTISCVLKDPLNVNTVWLYIQAGLIIGS